MLKSVFNTKVSNSEEISSPVVEAIRENTEAVKDKETAKNPSTFYALGTEETSGAVAVNSNFFMFFN